MDPQPTNRIRDEIQRLYLAAGKPPPLRIAKAAGVGYATVHGYLNGDRDILTAQADRIRRALLDLDTPAPQKN